jgi:hypothetical protein
MKEEELGGMKVLDGEEVAKKIGLAEKIIPQSWKPKERAAQARDPSAP